MSLVTLKAFCIAAGVTDCGILVDVKGDGKDIGKGLVTHAEVADVLSSETGYRPFVINKSDFEKVFNSQTFNFDVTIVLPNEPDNPIEACKADKFEFITRWELK